MTEYHPHKPIILKDGIVITQDNDLWFAHDPKTGDFAVAPLLYILLKDKINPLIANRTTQHQVESKTYAPSYRRHS